jgi:hypothetical protein
VAQQGDEGANAVRVGRPLYSGRCSHRPGVVIGRRQAKMLKNRDSQLMSLMVPPSRPRKGWSRVGGGSLLVTFRRLMQRIPLAPLDVNRLYFLEYAGIPYHNGAVVGSRHGTIVRDATPEDLQGITGCQNTPQAFLKRFRAHDYCAVAVAGSRIVGYQWFCDHSCHIEERYGYKITLPPDTIYAYDAFILPQYRLTGIWVQFHSSYLRHLMQRLRKKRILTMVDHGNQLSMNTHLRFGYSPVYVVMVTKVFGKSFFSTAPLCNRSGKGHPQSMSCAANAKGPAE